MKHTITMKEVQTKIKNGVTTFSKKDNSPRGCSTVSASEIKVGDEIVIDNYFTIVVDDSNVLRDELKFLKRNVLEHLDELDKLESENEVLQNDNENLISDLQDYETENAKLIVENEVLQNKITDLKNHNLELESEISELLRCGDDRVEKLETENDELKTQLHQYQALFADIERNMVVSLWESLLGTANN